MTVGELIEKLTPLPKGLQVVRGDADYGAVLINEPEVITAYRYEPTDKTFHVEYYPEFFDPEYGQLEILVLIP